VGWKRNRRVIIWGPAKQDSSALEKKNVKKEDIGFTSKNIGLQRGNIV